MRHHLQKPFILALLPLTIIAGETPDPVIPIAPYPGPIPFIDPHGPYGWPNIESVYYKRLLLHTRQTRQSRTQNCLIRYSGGGFYDSWLDDVCEGHGWFKRVYNEDFSPYDCYQTCANSSSGD